MSTPSVFRAVRIVGTALPAEAIPASAKCACRANPPGSTTYRPA